MTQRKSTHKASHKHVDVREARRILRKAASLNVRTLIEKRFLRKIRIMDGNKVETVTVLEAILRQLTEKAIKGDKRAPRVLALYQDYAHRHSTGTSQGFLPVRAPSSTPEESK